MKRLRIRTRWLDLLLFKSPRYVINGLRVHQAASQRIRAAASAYAFESLRRGGRHRQRLVWMIVFALLFLLPYLYVCMRVAFSNQVIAAIDTSLALPYGLGALLVGLVGAILTGGCVAVALIVLEPLVFWGMRPHFLQAIYAVSAGACLRCDYDLRGHALNRRCPECGTERTVKRI